MPRNPILENSTRITAIIDYIGSIIAGLIMPSIYSFFSKIFNKDHVVDIAKEELKNLTNIFFISRTGVYMFDFVRDNPLPEGKKLPKVFEEVYDKNRKTQEEYEELDNQLMTAREESSNAMEYREKAGEIHYSNCTSLACFLHESLQEKGVNSKIFGLGGAHHFVIAKDVNPNFIVVIDPWADTLFQMKIKTPVRDLEELSSADRLNIAKQHCQHTNLYPDYETGLKTLLSYDPNRSPKLEEMYTKQYFEISSTDRFFEFADGFDGPQNS